MHNAIVFFFIFLFIGVFFYGIVRLSRFGGEGLKKNFTRGHGKAPSELWVSRAILYHKHIRFREDEDGSSASREVARRD